MGLYFFLTADRAGLFLDGFIVQRCYRDIMDNALDAFLNIIAILTKPSCRGNPIRGNDVAAIFASTFHVDFLTFMIL
jgi:hypothetical protein